jgi:hypothetical protein
MNRQIFTTERIKNPIKILIACFLILLAYSNLFAQYRGAPVQKDKLLRVLRTKQLPTGDIVKVINRNGVNFELTPTVRNELIAAGATPAVLRAVLNNSRIAAKNRNSTETVENRKASTTVNTTPSTYNGLVEQGINAYKKSGNIQQAILLLSEAARMEPKNPVAYQSLGFVFLYGLRDFVQAEKHMREALNLNGTVEFLVLHDDNEKFTQMCEGSLFISREKIRFVSNKNVHNFESAMPNVADFKVDNISTSLWGKRSVFKFTLHTGNSNSKLRFAGLTEKSQESEMIKRLLGKS